MYSGDTPFDTFEGNFLFEFDASNPIEAAIYFDNSPTQSGGDFNVIQDEWDVG